MAGSAHVTPRCPPTCRRKVAHATEEGARLAVARMMISHPLDGDVRWYQCPYCRQWYVGRWRAAESLAEQVQRDVEERGQLWYPQRPA